jgi:hypothetical protein
MAFFVEPLENVAAVRGFGPQSVSIRYGITQATGQHTTFASPAKLSMLVGILRTIL